jgi:hypothetical protein
MIKYVGFDTHGIEMSKSSTERSHARRGILKACGISVKEKGPIEEVLRAHGVPKRRIRELMGKGATVVGLDQRSAVEMTREEYLATHSLSRDKPWVKEGIGRTAWYRRRREPAGASPAK